MTDRDYGGWVPIFGDAEEQMHDFELVEKARLAVAAAGPGQYQALCVLVHRLCDEVERIERLRMNARLNSAVGKDQ